MRERKITNVTCSKRERGMCILAVVSEKQRGEATHTERREVNGQRGVGRRALYDYDRRDP